MIVSLKISFKTSYYSLEHAIDILSYFLSEFSIKITSKLQKLVIVCILNLGCYKPIYIFLGITIKIGKSSFSISIQSCVKPFNKINSPDFTSLIRLNGWKSTQSTISRLFFITGWMIILLNLSKRILKKVFADVVLNQIIVLSTFDHYCSYFWPF